MHTGKYVHTYRWTYIHTQTYSHTYIHLHTLKHARTHANIRARIHTHTYTDTSTPNTHTNIHSQICISLSDTHIPCIYICMCEYVCICLRIYSHNVYIISIYLCTCGFYTYSIMNLWALQRLQWRQGRFMEACARQATVWYCKGHAATVFIAIFCAQREPLQDCRAIYVY